MERRSWGRFYSSKEQDNNGIEFPLLPNLEGCFDWASEEKRQVKSPFLDVEGPLRHRETRHRKSETMGKVPQVWSSRISKDNSDCTGKKSPNRGQSEARNECVIWFALFKNILQNSSVNVWGPGPCLGVTQRTDAIFQRLPSRSKIFADKLSTQIGLTEWNKVLVVP